MIWQVQLRSGSDVLWFEQGDGEAHTDALPVVERARQRARDYVQHVEVYLTIDPEQFVMVAATPPNQKG